MGTMRSLFFVVVVPLTVFAKKVLLNTKFLNIGMRCFDEDLFERMQTGGCRTSVSHESRNN